MVSIWGLPILNIFPDSLSYAIQVVCSNKTMIYLSNKVKNNYQKYQLEYHALLKSIKISIIIFL